MTDTPDNNAPQGGQAAEGQGSEVVNNNWYESLEGEQLGYVQNKGWNTEDGHKNMLKAYQELERFKGAPADKLIKLPEDGDYSEVYNKLGRPESPEGYEFAPNEGMELDEGRMSWFSNAAHELGLNKQQHNALVKATYDYEASVKAESEERAELERTNNLNQLKKEWGAAYDERIVLGKRAARAFADDGMLNALEDSIGSNTAVLKMFAKIGESISEDKLPNAESETKFGYSREQAQSDFKELKESINADKERLNVFNTAKGKDWDKFQSLLRVING